MNIPGTISPFFVGIIQFIMVDNLGPEKILIWIFSLAVLFAGMHGIAHFDMTRARQNEENAEFFANRGRATIRDFLPTIIAVAGLLLLAVILLVFENSMVLKGFAMLVGLSIIIIQLMIADNYWRISMTLDSTDEPE